MGKKGAKVPWGLKRQHRGGRHEHSGFETRKGITVGAFKREKEAELGAKEGEQWRGGES